MVDGVVNQDKKFNFRSSTKDFERYKNSCNRTLWEPAAQQKRHLEGNKGNTPQSEMFNVCVIPVADEKEIE